MSNAYVVVQAHPHFIPSYLREYEGNGANSRSWDRDPTRAFVFTTRDEAEIVAAGIRSNYVSAGHQIEVQEVWS